MDFLSFIQDIFSLGIPEVSYQLTNAVIKYLLIPHIYQAKLSTKQNELKLKLALFLLNTCIRIFSHKPMLDFIFHVLFQQNLTSQFAQYINQKVLFPCSYSFKWRFKNFYDNFSDFITGQLQATFYKKYQKRSMFTEQIRSDVFDKRRDQRRSQIFKKKKKFKSTLLMSLGIRKYFTSDIIKFENEQKRLSMSLGVITYDKLERDYEKLLFCSPLDHLDLMLMNLSSQNHYYNRQEHFNHTIPNH